MGAAIECRELSKSYGKVAALDRLTLAVEPGEAVGYLGPNGAGKTTTIRLLLGLIRATGGSASLFGVDAQADPVAAHRRLAFVPGEAALWPSLTGADTLTLLGRVHGSVDETYKQELVERFQLDPGKRVRAYSKGNRQKVLLIAALMTRADLLLLDEPTSGLDPLMEQTFRACVREALGRGQTVFLSSHSLSEVEAVCERVVILRQGRVVEQGLLADMRHLSALSIHAELDHPVPDLSGIAGLAGVQIDGSTLRCQATGSLAPLLSRLAPAGIRRLISTEPSLEELFLAHYGELDDAA